MSTEQKAPQGFVSIQNLHNALDDLRKLQAQARMDTAKIVQLMTGLETIRAMVTDESGHNMQKVGTIANDALNFSSITLDKD